jgi:hypothetical protein
MEEIQSRTNPCGSAVGRSSPQTIHSGEAYLEAPNTYIQLEARAREIVPDTRDNGPVGGYFIEERSYRGNYEIWT